MVYLIFIILFILFYFLNLSILENFKNNSCNTFFKNKTFCTLDVNTNQCKCTYQKDGVNIPYQGPASCCHEVCRKINKLQCNKPIENKEGSYYCNIYGTC